MKPFPKHPEKILIRSTNWIGDAVMTIPAVRSIRAAFPNSEITLLSLPWVSDVFRYSPWVDHLFIYDKQGIHRGIRGKLRLVGELRQQHFDCAIILQNAFEAAFITTLAGIPVRGGYTTDGRALFLTHGVKKSPEIKNKHQVYYYQEMLRGLELETGPDNLELFLPGSEITGAQDKLGECFADLAKKRPVFGLNPGAAYGPAKRWPAEKFEKLAQILCSQLNGLVIIFGTEADNETARQIQQGSGNPDRILDLTGKTNLVEAMAYIGQCDVFVTNDSGLMHVGAALKTPLVALFGSTDHLATGPFSQNAKVLRKKLPCSPCKKTHCPEKHFRCMELIEVDEVLAAVKDMMTI